jgi:hypothetical protein
MKIKQITAVLVILFFIAGSVFAQNESDFEIIVENNNVTIVGYSGNRNQLIIPREINGMPVTVIEERAFRSKGLTSVTLPDSVTEIGRQAFMQNYLTDVTIPNSIRTIGEQAFLNNRMTRINIPDSVDNVGELAFARQTSNFRTDGPNPFFIMIYKGEVTIITYNGRGGNVIIPETINNMPVIAIEVSAFSYKRISSITIPNTVRIIGNEAFVGNNLTDVNIPDSVISIGNSAFANNELRNVNVPNSVISMGRQVFDAFDLNAAVRSDLEKRFGEGVFVLRVMNPNGSIYRQ